MKVEIQIRKVEDDLVELYIWNKEKPEYIRKIDVWAGDSYILDTKELG